MSLELHKIIKKYFTLFFLLSCPFMVACEDGKSAEPLAASQLLPFQACVQDSDCVYANNGCCDCANGGEEVAINANQTATFADQFDCARVVCTLLARDPACGSGSVSCANHTCNYALPK